jgi:hypothetical protein
MKLTSTDKISYCHFLYLGAWGTEAPTSHSEAVGTVCVHLVSYTVPWSAKLAIDYHVCQWKLPGTQGTQVGSTISQSEVLNYLTPQLLEEGKLPRLGLHGSRIV